MIRFLLIYFFLLNGQCFLVKDSSQHENHRHSQHLESHRHFDTPSRRPLILNPFIEEGKILEGQKAAKVVGILENLESYSGYFTVNKTYDRNLFFWYFPAEEQADCPVLLWLQGGPGGTSMFGLVMENGPIQVDLSGSPSLRPHRWTRNHHVIYVDSPAGTGFSYPEPADFFGEDLVSADLYAALEQFFQLFPHIATNDFYVTGESYAGFFVPSVGYAIHKRNSEGKVKINLKGLIIGNGVIMHDYWSTTDNSYQNGLVGEAEINPYNYLEQHQPDVTGMLAFFNRADIQHLIHVGVVDFQQINNKVSGMVELADSNFSVVPIVEELLQHYPILYYYGQLDTVCPYPVAEDAIYRFRWSGYSDFSQAQRKYWTVGQELAGYIKSGGNLTFALVRNAGHMVPRDQPISALNLINRFINKELPL